MAYEFKFTEQNIAKATEFETKTLLYLLGIDPDRLEISYIFVDCFNDLTGSDKHCKSLWDFQSKGVSNLTPRKIGESLITLFENYNSEFNFRKYALFIPPPKQAYVVDSTLTEFTIKNFTTYRKEIREGLIAEYIRRAKISNISSDESQRIDLFLDIVTFISDNNEKYVYVKNLVSFKDKDLKSNEFYTSIFDDIRTAQASKKTISIHKCVINDISEVLLFDKHLQVRDIKILVINRLVGVDLFNRKAIPIDFLPEMHDLDKNDAKDLIQDCNAKISRAVFNKNNSDVFWRFLEKCLIKIVINPELSSREVYDHVSAGGQIKYNHLSGLSGIFLISLIKEGLDQ